MSDQYRDSVRQMDRGVYERLVDSLATGRWPDGRALTEAQRQHAMRAVIAWGELHLPAEARVGFIDKGHKAEEVCDEPEPIAWKESQHE
ncbi:MAG: YeaC family protein [Luminiphilus sp.]|nr:YeaC family protein [Luminiphilus sp.]